MTEHTDTNEPTRDRRVNSESEMWCAGYDAGISRGVESGEADTAGRIAAWLEARPCHAEGHDTRWCAMCNHDGDTADAIRRGDWKGEA